MCLKSNKSRYYIFPLMLCICAFAIHTVLFRFPSLLPTCMYYQAKQRPTEWLSSFPSPPPLFLRASGKSVFCRSFSFLKNLWGKVRQVGRISNAISSGMRGNPGHWTVSVRNHALREGIWERLWIDAKNRERAFEFLAMTLLLGVGKLVSQTFFCSLGEWRKKT